MGNSLDNFETILWVNLGWFWASFGTNNGQTFGSILVYFEEDFLDEFVLV
jgi:hypothetical protein